MTEHPRGATCAAPEFESFRAELRVLLADRRRHRTIDGVPCVVATIPEGMHDDLRALNALVAPGRVAVEWVLWIR